MKINANSKVVIRLIAVDANAASDVDVVARASKAAIASLIPSPDGNMATIEPKIVAIEMRSASKGVARAPIAKNVT